MTFSEQYEILERKFCERVQADYDADHGWSAMLRNIPPEEPVDFVLVAMEPSGGKVGSHQSRPDDWEKVKDKENRNFCGSIGDFILHFGIREYLCQDGDSYYLTDLSKGAMPTGRASKGRWQRYARWYPLLKEELRLVAKPGHTRLVAIGRTVEDYLNGTDLCRRIEQVLHYSANTTPHLKKAIQPWEDEFAKFRLTVCSSDIEQTAREVLVQAGYSEKSRDEKISQLQKGAGLTEPRKMLLFYYKKRFESLRTDDHIILQKKGLTLDARELVHVPGEKVIVGPTARNRDLRGRRGTFDGYSDAFVLVDGVRRYVTTGNICMSCPVCGIEASYHPSEPCPDGTGR